VNHAEEQAHLRELSLWMLYVGLVAFLVPTVLFYPDFRVGYEKGYNCARRRGSSSSRQQALIRAAMKKTEKTAHL
jgi:hypothetical protein